MGMISGPTIISSISLFHITIAFFFLTSPSTIADQTLVFIIGEAMGMPYTSAFGDKSQPLAFLGAALFIIGITDLVSVSLPEEVSQYHWGSQAPVRLMLFGSLAVYSYAFSSSSPLYDGQIYRKSAWGEGLKNRVVFTWAFLEMITWFWVFLTLRDERRELATRQAMKRAAQDEMM